MLKTPPFFAFVSEFCDCMPNWHTIIYNNRWDQFDYLVIHFKKIIQAAITLETQARLEKYAVLLQLFFFTDQKSSVFFPSIACSSAWFEIHLKFVIWVCYICYITLLKYTDYTHRNSELTCHRMKDCVLCLHCLYCSLCYVGSFIYIDYSWKVIHLPHLA